jgi:hypothetical protein
MQIAHRVQVWLPVPAGGIVRRPMRRILSALAGVVMLLPHADAEPFTTPPLLAPAPPVVERPSRPKPVDPAGGKAGPLVKRKKPENGMLSRLATLEGAGRKEAPKAAAPVASGSEKGRVKPEPNVQGTKAARPGSAAYAASLAAGKSGTPAGTQPVLTRTSAAMPPAHLPALASPASNGPTIVGGASAAFPHEYSTGPRLPFCQSPLGRFGRFVFTPLRIASGGRLPECCPDVPSAAALAHMTPENTSLPEVTAAKIKYDQAGAGARRAAVRYLGTVDCHYFPEAEEALLAALRCDRNELVRLEAARALGNGSCCARRTVQALHLVISGGCSDYNPAETSARVKAAAVASMQKCLACGSAPPASEPVEAPAPRPYSAGQPSTATNHRLQQVRHVPPSPEERKRTEEAIAVAWRTLAERVSAPESPPRPAGGRQKLLEDRAWSANRQNVGRLREENAPTRPQVSGNDTQSNVNVLGLTPIGRIPAQP